MTWNAGRSPFVEMATALHESDDKPAKASGVRILGRADLAQAMSKLYDKLDTLYREIVNRSVVTAAVDATRSDCNDYFLALEDYKRELLDSPSKSTGSSPNQFPA